MGVQIVTISCTACPRSFRTAWSVIEHHAPRSCAACGSPLVISAPEPVSVLSDAEPAPVRPPLRYCDDAA